MLPVYNQFFAIQDVIQHKTTYGHLKAYNDKFELKVDFVNSTNSPCIIFFYPGNQTADHVDDDLIESVVQKVLCNRKNILILDTIIEDFVNPPFIKCVEKLLDKDISAENIKILTSSNPPELFRHMFFKGNFIAEHGVKRHIPKFDCIDILSYDGFNSSFTLDLEAQKEELPEIKPRDIKKRFSLLQKNSRYCRKIVHAYFVHNNLVEDNVYAWHNIGEDPEWGDNEIKALEHFNIPPDLERYKQPILFDDVMDTHEWFIEDQLQECAFHCYVETSAIRDQPNTFWGETRHHKDYYFLTEKAFKSFWYGLPYIHISYPLEDFYHKKGYKEFKSLFDYEKVPSQYHYNYLENDFNCINKIQETSIDELNNILNDPLILGYLRHNRKMLLRQLPLIKLRQDLENYCEPK